jgi:hypothetical protein
MFFESHLDGTFTFLQMIPMLLMRLVPIAVTIAIVVVRYRQLIAEDELSRRKKRLGYARDTVLGWGRANATATG